MPTTLPQPRPLIRCMNQALFPKRIPHFSGTTLRPFHVLRCTNELALWRLEDISGHAMCIPERGRLSGRIEARAAAGPTPIILDITASFIHRRYHQM